MQQKGFVKIDDKLYFFSYANGATKTGWQTIDGVNHFYCNEDGTVARGLTKIGEKTYYFNENGMQQKGFVKIDGKAYFFSYANGATKTGWQTMDGLNSFYCNEDGTVAVGFQTINGKVYYFDGQHYYLKKEGFQSLDGQNYFYTYNDGSVAVGFQTINGKVYYFGSQNYYLKKEGFQSLDGQNYFYTYNDGSVAVGFQTINGKVYYFGSQNYYLKKEGFQSLDGQNYFYTYNDGSVAVGFQTINNKLYYFSVSNYYLKTGWQTIDGQDYFYCNEDGTVAVGNQNVEGREYLFDSNGYVQGFSYLDGKMYYNNPDGSLATGVQRLVGKYFLFDSTGAFVSYVNQLLVIDISAHQGKINWDQVKLSGNIDGVILRIGYGNIEDSEFKNYISEIKRFNIPYGIYLFSYAVNTNDAIDEANFTNDMIVKYNLYPNLGIYYDIESWSYRDNSMHSINQTLSDISQIQKMYDDISYAYITTLNTKISNKYKIKIYSGLNFINNYFGSYSKEQVGWVAQWASVCTYNGYYIGWQFTSSGSVPGISTLVDMSYFYL